MTELLHICAKAQADRGGGGGGCRHWLGPVMPAADRSIIALITAWKDSCWACSEDEDLGSKLTSAQGVCQPTPKTERGLAGNFNVNEQVKDSDICLSFFLNLYQLLLFSCPVMPDSLRPHGLQNSRLPCPSPSLRVCSNSCPWRQRSL